MGIKDLLHFFHVSRIEKVSLSPYAFRHLGLLRFIIIVPPIRFRMQPGIKSSQYVFSMHTFHYLCRRTAGRLCRCQSRDWERKVRATQSTVLPNGKMSVKA